MEVFFIDAKSVVFFYRLYLVIILQVFHSYSIPLTYACYLQSEFELKSYQQEAKDLFTLGSYFI